MTRQGTRVWNASEALDSLDHLLHLGDCDEALISKTAYRPALSEKQRDAFVRSAKENGDLCQWLEPRDMELEQPRVYAPLGALRITAAGAIDMPLLCTRLKQHAVQLGADWIQASVERIEDEANCIQLVLTQTGTADRLNARHAVLCAGAGYRQIVSGPKLNLHAIKGQAISLAKPANFGSLPTMSGSGYVIDTGDLIVAGSSYDHDFSELAPERVVSERIRKKVATMAPEIETMNIVSHHAGVRTTVPGSYLPMIGAINIGERVWLVGGLGSKGLLMSAWISRKLHDFVTGHLEIPKELRLTFMS